MFCMDLKPCLYDSFGSITKQAFNVHNCWVDQVEIFPTKKTHQSTHDPTAN